jgi:hypothetical protein
VGLQHLEDRVLVNVLLVICDEFPELILHHLNGFLDHNSLLGKCSPQARFHLIYFEQLQLHQPSAQQHSLWRVLLLVSIVELQHPCKVDLQVALLIVLQEL